MPRYFFHLLHPDRAPVWDSQGLACEDDEVAKEVGMLSLDKLMAEAGACPPVPETVSVQIVRDGFGIVELLTGLPHLPPQPTT